MSTHQRCFVSVSLQTGYLAGCGARIATRATIVLFGAGGLMLYGLHRLQLVEVKADRMRDLAAQHVAAQQRRVADVMQQHPAIAKRAKQLLDTIVSTAHGFGFALGFMIAFK